MKSGTKGKITPIKEKVGNSSYAKPTLRSKFRSVKKTINRLAKYKPTQEIPRFIKSSKGKIYRMSKDPQLIQSLQALSKASLNNAEAIYKEAKQDLLLNSSLPVAKILQSKEKEREKQNEIEEQSSQRETSSKEQVL